MNTLTHYGFGRYQTLLPEVERELAAAVPRHEPARVVRQERDLYRVITARGEREAVLAGRLRLQLAERDDAPVPGDWVLLSTQAQAQVHEGRVAIAARLPRASHLSRAAVGAPGQGQVVAANLDTVCLVTGLDRDLNLRRIERYLSAIAAGGARAVLVLNKADLWSEERVAALRAEATASAAGAAVHVVSVLSGAGLAELRAEVVRPELTVAFVGSSGVGKSTLTNAFLGAEVQATGAVRAQDDRGRHTTTRRDLFLVEGGGVLIDTPGMRELGLWDAEEGLGLAFPEVTSLARECFYRDCSHTCEPGCAVIGAVEGGDLDEERYEGYQKLAREAGMRSKKERKERRLERRRANRRRAGRPRTDRRDYLAEW
ncbi:MAG: ribosome small subunit-dependent GTPase A [Planctomycetota bacterium]